jgi:hypothetical protein
MVTTRSAGTILERSLGAPSKVKLTIHHQFPGIELVSPECVSNVTCYLSHQRVDVGSTMKASFNNIPDHDESIGALMYKLQRKNNDQSNENDISNEEEALCTQLVIIWKVYKSGRFYVYSFLIEHDGGRIWNRDQLMELAKRCESFNIQHGPIEDTWLMYDHTVLMIRVNVTRAGECYRVKMTMSEANINEDTRKPWYIGLNR